MGKHDSELHFASRRIVLAHELPFTIGTLRVEPATRQIGAAGLQQTIEPKIMQVLVALADARGRVVTRDELVERCWKGRIVGDDAINRAISQIRRIAREEGSDSFGVETIRRVGYRLRVRGSPGAAESSGRTLTVLNRRQLLLGGGALGLAGIATLGTIVAFRRSSVPPEARELFDRSFVLRFSGSPQDNRQAIAYLREATRIAPTYGRAWGALALAYREALDSEGPERTEGFEQLLSEAVRQSDRFDPGNGDAAAARLPRMPYIHHCVELEQIARGLIRAHPQHVAGFDLLGNVLMNVGRWNEAADALVAAKARNSFSPLISYQLITALWSAGRISDADQEIAAAVQRWPQNPAIWRTKIKILEMTGRSRAAYQLSTDPTSRPMDDDTAEAGVRNLVLSAELSKQKAELQRAIHALAGRFEQSRRVAHGACLRVARRSRARPLGR